MKNLFRSWDMPVPVAMDEVSFDEYVIWADKCYCEKCRINTESNVTNQVEAAYFCFVPIIKWVSSRYLVCEQCGNRSIISKTEFNEIYNRQHDRSENGIIPPGIIERDRQSKIKEYKGKLISFIFSLVFLPIMLGVIFTIKWDWNNLTSDISMLGFFLLLLTVYTFFPVIRSGTDFFRAKRELKYYK